MKTLEEGDIAPPFLELTANKGSPVVVYFYPKDFTPGCTTQACNFRDLYDRITEKGAIVLGVSPDSPDSHERFIAQHGLPYALVSDIDHQICEAYGVWKRRSRDGRESMGVERSTFIVGPDGRIRRVFREVTPAAHVEEVLDAL